MASFEIVFKQSVAKNLSRIARKDVKRILARIEALADDPRPPASEKLSDEDRYRIRQGVYRIIYEIQDKQLVVVAAKVGHRRNVYRRS